MQRFADFAKTIYWGPFGLAVVGTAPLALLTWQGWRSETDPVYLQVAASFGPSIYALVWLVLCMPVVGFLCAVTGVYPRSIWMTFFAGLAGVLVWGLVLSITLSWTLLPWGFMPALSFSIGFAIRGLRGS